MQRRPILAAAVTILLAICDAVPAPAQGVKSRPPAAAPQCDPANFRVIVDVGHTPESPGAVSARGVDEYAFNLALAKVIDTKLRDAGFNRAHLLLASGQAIPSLVRRVAQANALSADLLVSIHHDSVPEAFKSMWEFGGVQRPYSDRFRGHSIFVSADNPDYQGSVTFAKMLGAKLKARGLEYTQHYKEAFMGSRRRLLVDPETGVYRYDQLLILRTARMPSVLLEAGSIIHRDEEELMGTEEHQLKIAGAVTEAVETFCSLRPAKTQRASTQR
ncbi:N-acetylmuramoyl-L-alanine amidase [Pseudorhodoplanes sp.]|uniref:N-acetylmuramoyl-L-alanine amidase family protein n=1 Tax=Pseudorhodoplanes sp. TaxID=1934341 RepID=UPI002CFD7846|nr:N-acetylmuramoyl-L-alanine amidase [Pseudorhodoplanes sp.]HWV51516.1 N-acetylmuramoyl-L-alanine amidase [Pseudorhodoplanes sp.]